MSVGRLPSETSCLFFASISIADFGILFLIPNSSTHINLQTSTSNLTSILITTTPTSSTSPTSPAPTMSHLKFYAYADHGLRLRDMMHYSQAVRVGDRIECSGQCTFFSSHSPSQLTNSSP